MVKYKSFGMLSEDVPSGNVNDFLVCQNNTDSNQQNSNPYGTDWFDNPNNMAKIESDKGMRITSIPSPYARMHITDLAFRELNTGKGKISQNAMSGKTISKDYLHAMSHCLDFYELFFYYKDLDLSEKGIGIEQISLVSSTDPATAGLFADNPKLKRYVETLDLYRRQYMNGSKGINAKRPDSYKFKFDSLYVFWDKGSNTVIGATSPFTGFFAKSTCNVLDGDKQARLVLKVNDSLKNGKEYTHKLLTNDIKDWRMLQDRPLEFRKFMYLLLHQNNVGLNRVFENLFNSVKQSIEFENEGSALIPQFDAMSFSEEYPEFNFGDEKLPKILSGREAYLRTNSIDRSYLKYLLYLYTDKPISIKIPEESFKKEISQREFPDNSGNTCPWICVNDLLTDALFVLPYDVNDKYVAVEYYDRELKKSYRRCLLPIKREVLEYFPQQSLSEIAKDMKIVKYENHFVVTFDITLARTDREGNPVKVSLRREYWPNDFSYPNGKLIGPSEMDKFAFGIYPFVRSTDFTNIYKVLFYNKFDLSVSSDNNECKLDFYYFDQSDGGKRPVKFFDRSVKTNFTGVFDSKHPDDSFNSLYYSIEEGNENNRVKCIEFAELSVDIKDSLGKKVTTGTSLIVPQLMDKANEQVNGGNQQTDIAIDLGTSNTYVVYQHAGGSPREINTIHADGSELQFMNVEAKRDDYEGVKDEYGHDLYLRPSNEPKKGLDETDEKFAKRNKKAWTACMPTQFCEFIPSHIVPKKPSNEEINEGRNGKGFSFPIPTVINNLYLNGRPVSPAPTVDVSVILDNSLPLTHSAIPFAYYEIGNRKKDTIAEGDFKWCMNGNEISEEQLRNLTLFVGELMFIVRSHMLCEGYSLDQCRLKWTYPLSFDNNLVNKTTEVWTKAYQKYFNPNLEIDDEQTVNEHILSTNESLSPFYGCVSQADQNEYVLLMDVGGGSTDVIGYDGKKTQFISSFEFAGNALYLSSKRNNEFKKDEPNIFLHFLNSEKNCKTMKGTNPYFGDATCLMKEVQDKSNGLASIMNYGFQRYPKDFELLFDNEELKFLLKFHAASIVYHTAQLCHWYSKDALPHFIYLTGNGSKLFDLLKDEKKELFEKIFLAVYEKNEFDEDNELVIKSPKNPKAASAIGSLKAGDEVFNQRPKERAVMLGDAETVYAGKGGQHEVGKDVDRKHLLELVRANVNDFIDKFYDYLGTDYPIVKKDDMNIYVSEVEKQDDFKIGTHISDSYFFLYIARVMEKISVRLAEKVSD